MCWASIHPNRLLDRSKWTTRRLLVTGSPPSFPCKLYFPSAAAGPKNYVAVGSGWELQVDEMKGDWMTERFANTCVDMSPSSAITSDSTPHN